MDCLVQIQEKKGILVSLCPLAASCPGRNLNGVKSSISKSFIPRWPSELERRQYQTEHQDQEKHAALSFKPTVWELFGSLLNVPKIAHMLKNFC